MNLFWRFESASVFAGGYASKYKHRAERILSNYAAEHSIRSKIIQLSWIQTTG